MSRDFCSEALPGDFRSAAMEPSTPSFLQSLSQADARHIGFAVLGGVIFNIANLLLVAAIEIAGLAVAFPVGIGLALVIGVLLNYILAPQGNPLLLFGGLIFVVLAIVVDAMAYQRRETCAESGREKRRADQPYRGRAHGPLLSFRG